LVLTMEEKWTKQEVAIVILARKLLKAKGLARDTDVKGICEAAGISRKTGYEWAGKLEPMEQSRLCEAAQQELAHLTVEHEQLKRRYEDLRFENEGRKLAWKIHGVDELIKGKKNTTQTRRKRKR
jgi:hypothetical protein